MLGLILNHVSKSVPGVTISSTAMVLNAMVLTMQKKNGSSSSMRKDINIIHAIWNVRNYKYMLGFFETIQAIKGWYDPSAYFICYHNHIPQLYWPVVPDNKVFVYRATPRL